MENKNMPLVSVVIPVYNVEKYILEALRSVLNQSYENLEILIIDDESPDGSIALVKGIEDSRIKILRQKNRGLAGARNTGIRESTGEFVAFLDSDDYWHESKIKKQLIALQNDGEAGVAFCSSMFVDEDSVSLNRLQEPHDKKNFSPSQIFCRNPIGNGSVPLIRKSVLDKVAYEDSERAHIQYFDESLRQSEDVECWTRIAVLGGMQFSYIDEPLVYYRLNNGGLSADVNQQFESWTVVLNKLHGYAPELAAQCESSAKAFQYRYLARRCISQGRAWSALKLLVRGFRTDGRALFAESRKTAETIVMGLVLLPFPQRIQLRIVQALM